MSWGAKIRDEVAARDGWRCRYCGCAVVRPPAGRNHTAAEAPTIASLDHWIPRSRGGSDELTNLVMSCRPCNDEKASLTGPEYLAVLEHRRRAVAWPRRRGRYPVAVRPLPVADALPGGSGSDLRRSGVAVGPAAGRRAGAGRAAAPRWHGRYRYRIENEARPRRCSAEASEVTRAQLREGNQSDDDRT